MGERNVNQPLPEKIEQRLAELLARGEFDEEEVAWCRRSYWGAPDDWHKILVACFDMAAKRESSGEKVAKRSERQQANTAIPND